jgi:hypothetical protein
LSKYIELDIDKKIVDSKTKVILMDLEMSDIIFKESEFIVKSPEDEEKKITGITYIIAELFIEWGSKFGNEKYKLIKFTSGWNQEIKSFKHSEILYEFINSTDYAIKVYTKTYNSGTLALDNDGRPLTISNISIFNNVSFRMMKLPEEKK